LYSKNKFEKLVHLVGFIVILVIIFLEGRTGIVASGEECDLIWTRKENTNTHCPCSTSCTGSFIQALG
jgi:hypothetical protein